MLFGLHLVVNVLLPQWKLDLDRLSQEVLRLESRRDDLNSELSLRRARVKKARARVDAIRSRYSAAVQSGIEALGRSEEVVADRVRELNKHASIHATAVQSKISACNGFCGRLYGFYDRTLGSGRCDKLSSNCRDATAFARALGKNAATYQKRLEQARRLVDRARMNLEQLRAAAAEALISEVSSGKPSAKPSAKSP